MINIVAGIVSLFIAIVCILFHLHWGYAAANIAIGLFNIWIGLVSYED